MTAGAEPISSATNKTDTAPPRFHWHIDEIFGEQVAGWIMLPDQPAHRCIVALKERGQVIAQTIASRFRNDLVLAGIGDGCYSFLLPMPQALFDGAEHVLEVVEGETGTPLIDIPVRWRAPHASAAGSDRMAGTRLFGLRQEPELRAEHPSAEFRGNIAAAVPLADVARATHRSIIRAAPVTGTRVMFDISDLVYYIGHHPNLTGIQRVQSSIVLAILRHKLVPRENLIFLSFDARTRNWVSVPTAFLATLLEDLFAPEAQRLVQFPAEEARYGLLPGARNFDGFGVLDDGNELVLCLLGAAWVHQDYIHRVLAFKRQFGTRFVMTVHDLIPIYARETCDQDTARVFEEFMRRALRHVDHVLSVSENTAKDIKRYTEALQIPEPPVTVTKNGSSFAEFLPQLADPGDLRPSDIPERFVLFVATIEGRKNHQLMLDLWRRMIDEGMDPPHLVCVGRLGWRSTSFISALVETNYLGGKGALAARYQRYRFAHAVQQMPVYGLPDLL